MNQKKFVFAGNRAFVYQKMIDLDLNVTKVFAVKGSYFQKYLNNNSIEYEEIIDKISFIQKLKNSEFDFFVSNGFPFILPISELKTDNKQFVNIHPSYLPDLRGADPVPGAILFGRDAGATCHYMDDGIDTGDIISQVRIDYTPDLDAGLLYQLSFMAEQQVFEESYKRNFIACKKQNKHSDNIYYSFKEDDLRIDFTESLEKIFRKIKAFNTASKGAYFIIYGEKFKVFDVEIIQNSYMNSFKDLYQENNIIMLYENNIVIKKDDELLKLKDVTGKLELLRIGDVLS